MKDNNIKETVWQTVNQAGTCCLCGGDYYNFGHNPAPLVDINDTLSRCCSDCNADKVIPARISAILGKSND